MHPTLIEIFGIRITTYGFMVAVAFATAWLLIMHRGKKLGYSEAFIQNLILFVALGAFGGARLLHVLSMWDYYASHPLEIFFSREGFVYLGGLIGGVGLGVWYTRRSRRSALGIADLFAPYLALAQSIGRIGCFLYGCCYGGVCQLPWGVRFPHNSPAFYQHWADGLISSNAAFSLPVHPTQIYHSFSNFALFGVLLWLRSRQTFKGQVGLAYIMLYSVGRFILEFFRGDNRGELIGLLSTSQEISFVMFFAALGLYWWLRQKAWQPERVVETLPQKAMPAQAKS